MNTEWQVSHDNPKLYEGIDRKSGDIKWMASRADLIFGSNSQLRAIAKFMHVTMQMKNSLTTL